MCEATFKGMKGLQIFHVADMRAEVGIAALGKTKGRFQFGPDSENRLDIASELNWQWSVASRTANGQLARLVNANDRIIADDVNVTVVEEK
jgi:hypothetical protein